MSEAERDRPNVYLKLQSSYCQATLAARTGLTLLCMKAYLGNCKLGHGLELKQLTIAVRDKRRLSPMVTPKQLARKSIYDRRAQNLI